ncbi:hypothetical protein TNCV_475181 [Trichonephila clavipes]|nr:hypothetical protein TNCV_475181 [Trichonephila clavipes]
MVPASTKSCNKTPWASPRKLRGALYMQREIVLNFFRTGDDEFFHSIDVTFATSICTHDSSLVTQSETESHCHSHDNARNVPSRPPRIVLCVSGSVVRAPIVLTLFGI